jgi:hypothetical protein
LPALKVSLRQWILAHLRTNRCRTFARSQVIKSGIHKLAAISLSTALKTWNVGTLIRNVSSLVAGFRSLKWSNGVYIAMTCCRCECGGICCYERNARRYDNLVQQCARHYLVSDTARAKYL